jgi:hypothetical protein
VQPEADVDPEERGQGKGRGAQTAARSVTAGTTPESRT